MTRNISNLLSDIDSTAVACCELLDNEKKEEFFQFQESRVTTNNSAPARYRSLRTYYKGGRAGETRDVYRIDGKMFSKLWNLIYPYISKSVNTSCYSHNDLDYKEDKIADIRYLLLRALTFFGPTPNNLPFSKYLKLAVNNELTNEHHVRNDYAKSKINFESISLFDTVGSEEGSDIYIVDTIAESSSVDIEFETSIPSSLKEIAYSLEQGESLNTIANKLHVSRVQIQEKIQELALCLS